MRESEYWWLVKRGLAREREQKMVDTERSKGRLIGKRLSEVEDVKGEVHV